MREIEKFYEKEVRRVVGRSIRVRAGMANIEQLKRMPNYQRAIREGKVKAIVAEFNGLALGYVYVNERANGQKELVDGNHRSHAAMEVGYKFLPMIMTIGMTEQEEAVLWRKLNNNRSNPSATEDLNAAKWAKDPEAIKLMATVRHYGYRFAFEKCRPGRTIDAVQALRYAMRREALDETLLVCSTAWPDGDDARAGVTAPILKGIAVFLSSIAEEDTEKFSVERLIERIAKHHPSRLLGAATQATSRYSDVARRIAREMVEIYNGSLAPEKCVEVDFRPRRKAKADPSPASTNGNGAK